MNNTSPAFSFDSENFKHAGKVFLWSVGSAVVALIVAALNGANFPPQYALFVPIVNTLLVALGQFFSEQQRN